MGGERKEGFEGGDRNRNVIMKVGTYNGITSARGNCPWGQGRRGKQGRL